MKYKRKRVNNAITLEFILSLPRTTNEIGCWLYVGHLNNGYGEVTINRKRIYLHRVSAAVYLGLDINDDSVQVNHKTFCNNRACFNSEHVYVGTQTDNAKDLVITKTHRNIAKINCPKCGGRYRHEKRGTRYCRRCKNEKQNERHNAKNQSCA
jgi:hypothetical protein